MKKTASGYRLIFGYLGLFITFIGITMLLPLFVLFAYPQEAADWYCFAAPGGGAILVGIALFMLIFKRDKAQLGKHQDAILLVLIWLISIFVAAVPFIIKGELTFTQSIFETTSAFGTIGLTVFNESCFNSHIFVLYRSIICFLGGIGLVLIITSAISDRYGLKLYIAEGHNDKLMPNLAKSARLILGIYIGIILLGTGLFVLAGMPVFDALIHSISAVATGGFSSRPEGLIAFQGSTNWSAVQAISCILMIMGAINFLLHMFLITGKFRKVWRDCEIRTFLILGLIFIPLFFVAVLAQYGWQNPVQALCEGSFTFISAITTTGFANTASIINLGEVALFLIVIVNIIGGGMGSTAGGIKQYRLAIACKSFYWSTRERLSSSNYIYPHYVWRCGEQKEIKANDSSEAFSYIIIYIAILLLGGLVTTFAAPEGWTYGQALFEFSNALSSTGLSNGLCQTNAGVQWCLIVGMFLGRLEILSIFFALYRVGRDILRKETH
ncbi:MAG: TrkH family potassium uptake protein [Bacilli bacterium]|nr:TrkH family potassium uptake protein [Bacilli bacterium]